MRVAVLGMGGVGALIAAALSKTDCELILGARGETKEAIKNRGLIVNSDVLGNITVNPSIVADNGEEIGVVDAVIICCKNYSLEDVCNKYSAIVGENTVVVPMQNGISATEDIEKYLGKGVVSSGYIYCFSNIEEPGVIRHIGNTGRIGIGFADGRKNETALKLVDLLNEGGISTVYGGKEIISALWMKYMAMGGNSCAFIYHECNAGELREDHEKIEFIKGCYKDIETLAKCSGVELPEDIVEQSLEEFMGIAPNAISSLYRDIKNNKENTEFEAIVGNGYRIALKYGADVPCIKKVYEKMKNN